MGRGGWCGLVIWGMGCGGEPAAISDLVVSPWFSLHTELVTGAPVTDKYGAPSGGRELRGGEAVAVLDFDRDWRQDLVIVNGSDYFFMVRNWDWPRGSGAVIFDPVPFLDGAVDDGLAMRAKGLGVHDLDGDGWLDLYLANQGRGGLITYKRDPPNDRGLYRSAASSTWLIRDGQPVATALGIDGAGSKRLALFEDFDLDGFVDAYVSASTYYGIWYAGGSEPNKLYPGVPGGSGFGPDMLDEAFEGPMAPFWVDEQGRSVKNFKAAIVRDLDRNGKPDIITGSIADLWANHELDLCDPAEPGYQGGWERGLYVFENRSEPGAIRFADVTSSAYPGGHGVGGQGHVHSIVALDVDHDGDLDLMVSGNRGRLSHGTEQAMAPIVRLLRNDSVPGSIRLTDITETSGLGFLNRVDALPAPYPIHTTLFDVPLTLYPALMAAVPVDVNNDGHVDVVAVDRQTFDEDPVNGAPLGLGAWIFLGDGAGGFRVVPVEEHGVTGSARDVSAGDFDNDGRVDLVFVDGSAGGQDTSNLNRVWFNQVASGGHWLVVHIDELHNRFGVGARVTVREAGTERVIGYDEVRTDFNYRSKRDAVLHVGLGATTKVDVSVVFRDGATATWREISVDQHLRITRTPLSEKQGRYYIQGDERVWAGGVLKYAVERGGEHVESGYRRDLDEDGDLDVPFPPTFVPGGMIAAVGREGYLYLFDNWEPPPPASSPPTP